MKNRDTLTGESELMVSLTRKSRAEGWAAGYAKAWERSWAKTGARLLCIRLVSKFRPRVVSMVQPALDACDDTERLRRWALAAPRATDAEFVRMIIADLAEKSQETSPTRPAKARSRTPRPARRAKSART